MKQVRYESESADTRDIKTLFQEYSQIKGAEVCFVSFGNELEHLEEIYSAPKGSRIVAYDNDYPVGCVALKKVDDTTCEMKRLYVRPDYRKQGIATTLINSIIETAKKYGYKKISLETLPDIMSDAVLLYNSLGFMPLPGDDDILKMEMDL